MNKLLIVDVVPFDSIARSGPNKGQTVKGAVVTYESLNGRASRISPSIAFALAMKGQFVEGYIAKADVMPYDATIKRVGNEPITGTFTRRNVVVFAGETLAQACKASGHTLSSVAHEAAPTVMGTNIDAMLATAGLPTRSGDPSLASTTVTGQNEFDQQSANQQNRETLLQRSEGENNEGQPGEGRTGRLDEQE